MELMIGLGVMGVLTLGVTSVMKKQTTSKRASEAKLDTTALTNYLSYKILTRESRSECRGIFQGKKLGDSLSKGDITAHVPIPPGLERNFELSSLVLSRGVQEKPVGIKGDYIMSYSLELRLKLTGPVVGARDIRRSFSFPLLARVNSSGLIQDCTDQGDYLQKDLEESLCKSLGGELKGGTTYTCSGGADFHPEIPGKCCPESHPRASSNCCISLPDPRDPSSGGMCALHTLAVPATAVPGSGPTRCQFNTRARADLKDWTLSGGKLTVLKANEFAKTKLIVRDDLERITPSSQVVSGPVTVEGKVEADGLYPTSRLGDQAVTYNALWETTAPAHQRRRLKNDGLISNFRCSSGLGLGITECHIPSCPPGYYAIGLYDRGFDLSSKKFIRGTMKKGGLLCRKLLETTECPSGKSTSIVFNPVTQLVEVKCDETPRYATYTCQKSGDWTKGGSCASAQNCQSNAKPGGTACCTNPPTGTCQAPVACEENKACSANSQCGEGGLCATIQLSAGTAGSCKPSSGGADRGTCSGTYKASSSRSGCRWDGSSCEYPNGRPGICSENQPTGGEYQDNTDYGHEHGYHGGYSGTGGYGGHNSGGVALPVSCHYSDKQTCQGKSGCVWFDYLGGSCTEGSPCAGFNDIACGEGGCFKNEASGQWSCGCPTSVDLNCDTFNGDKLSCQKKSGCTWTPPCSSLNQSSCGSTSGCTWKAGTEATSTQKCQCPSTTTGGGEEKSNTYKCEATGVWSKGGSCTSPVDCSSKASTGTSRCCSSAPSHSSCEGSLRWYEQFQYGPANEFCVQENGTCHSSLTVYQCRRGQSLLPNKECYGLPTPWGFGGDYEWCGRNSAGHETCVGILGPVMACPTTGSHQCLMRH